MREQDKESGGRAMVDKRQLILGTAVLAAAALLLIIGLTPRTQDDPSRQTGTDSAYTLNPGCQLIQHLIYAPCGHELTRRVTLPDELAGKRRGEVEEAYDLWQITSFAADEVAMEQRSPLYCPEHLVLMADESGTVCVWQNRYGDALALLRELDLPLAALGEETQSSIRAGIGFDTEAELNAFIESIES